MLAPFSVSVAVATVLLTWPMVAKAATPDYATGIKRRNLRHAHIEKQTMDLTR